MYYLRMFSREMGWENGKWIYYLRVLSREMGCENGKWIYYLRILSREMDCENGKWIYYLRVLSREMDCENGKWMYCLRMLSSFGFLFQWHWEYWWTKCYCKSFIFHVIPYQFSLITVIQSILHAHVRPSIFYALTLSLSLYIYIYVCVCVCVCVCVIENIVKNKTIQHQQLAVICCGKRALFWRNYYQSYFRFPSSIQTRKTFLITADSMAGCEDERKMQTQQTALAEQILYRLLATLSQFSTAILSFGFLNIIRLVTFVELKLTLYVGNKAEC